MPLNYNGLNMSYLQYHTQCPICLGQRSIILSSDVKTINKKSDLKVELRECNNCKHWWHNPIPTQQYLSSLYEKRSEFVLGDDFLEPMKDVAKINLSEYKKDVINYDDYKPCLELTSNKEFNYLEIGCGKGRLFHIFRENKKICYGVEPGNWFDEPCIVSDISKLPKDIKFDVIVMHDVLEHLENPINMMTLCKNIANKDARIYCCFPNKDSFVAKIKKEKWDMVRPLGHLHYFSKKSASILFNASKWKIVERYTFPCSKIYLRNILRVKRFLADVIYQHHQWYLIGVAES